MATGKSLAELKVSDEDRDRLEKEAVFTPLPFVKRVVFISTPHRGSFLSKNWVRTLVLKMITLPQGVLQSTANLMKTVANLGVSEAKAHQFISTTSLDAMSPDNPILKTLADIPLAPGIKGHSIVAIDGDEKPPEGDDGVVKYTSAHVDYVESEFLVRSGHSSQGQSPGDRRGSPHSPGASQGESTTTGEGALIVMLRADLLQHSSVWSLWTYPLRRSNPFEGFRALP